MKPESLSRTSGAKRQSQPEFSRNDLPKADIVPVDILGAEFAATVGFIAKLVIDFRAAPYELIVERIDVIDPEIHIPKTGRRGPARNNMIVIVNLLDHHLPHGHHARKSLAQNL